MKIISLILTLIFSLSSCTPQPEAIDYGSDGCAFCRMNIVDPQYAAELVSSTGKVFKFDAIECMVNYLDKNQDTKFAYHLVNCYDQPKALQGVEEVTFLKCPQLASPMGAYLTAFSNGGEAQEIQAHKGGQFYHWTELLQAYEKHEKTFDFE